MNQFNRITSFISVVEENGFAAAARKHQLSTAAISRQITLLESHLKVQLLHRTTRRIVLTEMGTLYYQQVKKTMLELQEAESAITQSQDQSTGLLKIVSNRYFAMQFLLPRLQEFMLLNPQLQIDLQCAERFPDLVAEEVDILFGVSLQGQADWVRKRVSQTRYVYCCSPAYLKKSKPLNVPQDLIKHCYIEHSVRNPLGRLNFKNNIEIQLIPQLSLNDSQALRDCAIMGMGIVKLHDYIISEALENGTLVEVLKDWHEAEQVVYLYYQSTRYLQPKIRHFIDFYIQF